MAAPVVPVALLAGGAAALAWALTSKPAKAATKPGGATPVNPPLPSTPVKPPASPQPSGTYARVTTNDPAPSGDLYIVPSPGAAGIPGVGAEKNGIVKVLDWSPSNDSSGLYAKIAWPGGARLGPVTGYAKKRYLVPTGEAPVAPAIPTAPTGPGTPSGQAARVTTNDPAPSGDLYIVPSPGAAGIPGVGAEKNGIVYVQDWNPSNDGSGLYAKVAWPGGSRLGPVSGYAKKRYLIPVTTTTSGLGNSSRVIATPGKTAVVACAGGCRVRSKAGAHGETLAMLPAGTRVHLKKVVTGPKADRSAPGVGGWSLVGYGPVTGWVQSEWLKID